jgi:hypothetical protein
MKKVGKDRTMTKRGNTAAKVFDGERPFQRNAKYHLACSVHRG